MVAVTGKLVTAATIIAAVMGSRRQLRGSRSYAGTRTGITPADAPIGAALAAAKSQALQVNRYAGFNLLANI